MASSLPLDKDFVCSRHTLEVWIELMELRHLRYFVAVAEEGSLTNAAARRLHTAQPSLSRQIRDLELEVGVKLLERGARGIELTAAGRTFLDHARLALLQVEAAGEAARRAAQSDKAAFVIGFLAGPGTGMAAGGAAHPARRTARRRNHAWPANLAGACRRPDARQGRRGVSPPRSTGARSRFQVSGQGTAWSRCCRLGIRWPRARTSARRTSPARPTSRQPASRPCSNPLSKVMRRGPASR